MYVNQDLKFAIKYIDELQKIVRAQDDRIKRACNMTELQKLVKKPQNNRIVQLGTRINELETVSKAKEHVPVQTKGMRCYLM